MSNEEKDRALYKYPGTDTLRNKLDIRNKDGLEQAERNLVTLRTVEGIPGGRFGLKHLQDIHRHLFQDVYEWAGELRQVDFHKGGVWFLPQNRIEMGMIDIHARLKKQDYLKNLSHDQFAEQAGVIIGDINLVHPFREGNGRTQMYYLKQLGHQADHRINLTRFKRDEWIAASIHANKADYTAMAQCIRKGIDGPVREKTETRRIQRDRGGWER